MSYFYTKHHVINMGGQKRLPKLDPNEVLEVMPLGREMGTTGRATPFNKEIAEQILILTATTMKPISHILTEIKPFTISYIVFLRWLNDYPHFRVDYARAREQKGDTLVEGILELIDSDSKDMVEVADKKLKIDTLKWVASKLFPRRYGEHIDLPPAENEKSRQVFRIGGKELEF